MAGIELLDIDDLSASYWTRQRRELVQWFGERAPSFSEGYQAAVRLLHTPSFPARVHLICHLVRDIYRYLPAALGLKSTARPAEVFPSKVRELVDKWKEFPPTGNRATEDLTSDYLVSPQVFEHLTRIVNKSNEIGEQPTVGKQLAMALFRSLDRRYDEFIHPWIIKAFDAEFDFFVKRAHLARSAEKVPTDAGLTDNFETFERAFHSLVGPYFSGKEELDDILQDTNATTD